MAMPSTGSSHKWLRISCWFVALALGAAEAWATRFYMNPDGVSYLDIGDAYWRGDWHNAINAYWSPLYSWIVGFFLKAVKPSMYWEYPLVHLVNFLIYVATLAAFEFFLATFIAERRKHNLELLDHGEIGLSESSWWLLGYSLFVSSSILLITLHLVTPDMCVAAFVYLASALLLKIRSGTATRWTYVALGVVLGFGYLAKAVMFPLGFVFLITAALAGGFSKSSLRNTAVATVGFLSVASPFIAVISNSKQRLTFGDSGKITYEIFIDNVDIFIPREKEVTHPVPKINDDPLAHGFATPVQGTYPLWYDPAFWHEGIRPRFALEAEMRILKYALLTYVVILGSILVQLNVTVGLLMFYLMAPRPGALLKRMARNWPLLLPPAFAVAAYSVVYTEYRYVAPFLVLFWLAGFESVRLPASRMTRRFVANVILGISSLTVLVVVWSDFNNLRQPAPAYWQIAAKLKQRGIVAGDQIAVVAEEPFGDGGAFWARLARLQIVAQTRNLKEFYAADPSARVRLCENFKNAGAKAVLLNVDRPDVVLGPEWQTVKDYEYYIWNASGPKR